ncbi:ZnF3 [Penicillium brasilianum]|uniref:ZnF3 n=1 Tax=Penicillium brasilianum TaxID=104259 RepID=A0A1S9RHN1_PENBI|nr:ZnF3 [Penicillium brasilianum]
MACRMAQLLDLPNCKTDSRVEREVNIRTWWSLCMIDVWSSTGVRLPRLLAPRKNVPLPMDEVVFLQLSRDLGFDDVIQTNQRSSLLAEMVRLNHILQQINDFNIRVAESKLDAIDILSDVEHLSSQLDRWLDELPDHIRDTRENLERYSTMGLGRMFVAIYLGYYHFGQMLFYRFLHEDLESTSIRNRRYANKCKEHAGRLCDIVYSSETVPDCDAKYNMVGHVLVIASTVQIHSLLFESNEKNVTLAKMRLEKNFCIITQLCALWPTLDVCMDRLMAFHKACRESADTSFRMDQWMVRFLVEFATPVTDKTSHESDGGHWSLAELGISSD